MGSEIHFLFKHFLKISQVAEILPLGQGVFWCDRHEREPWCTTFSLGFNPIHACTTHTYILMPFMHRLFPENCRLQQIIFLEITKEKRMNAKKYLVEF